MRVSPFLLFVSSIYAGGTLLRHESPLDLSRWRQGDQANSNQILQISIALKIRNIDLGTAKLLNISDPSSPGYGRYLSAEDVTRMFEPEPSTVHNVMNWLDESGIGNKEVKISYGGDILSLSLSVQEAAHLLGTTFYHHTHQESKQEQITFQFCYTPRSLGKSINYILAASPVPTHRYARRQQIILNNGVTDLEPLPPDCFRQTTVSCLQNLYRIPDDVPPHPNNSFGVFEPSWFSWRPEDLDKFFEKVQKSSVGRRPKVEGVNGGYLQRNQSQENWYLESDLDFEYGMALISPHEVTNIQVGSYKQSGNLHDMIASFDQYFFYQIDPEK